MRYAIFAVFLIACQSANVISDDGSKHIARCTGDDCITCIAKSCPDGYDIVQLPTDGNNAILKCKTYTLGKKP